MRDRLTDQSEIVALLETPIKEGRLVLDLWSLADGGGAWTGIQGKVIPDATR
jgi:hypothetical protein